MTTAAEKLAGLNVSIDFEAGPKFVIPFTLDDPTYGALDFGTLASDSALTVNYTARTTNINIRRGRDILQDAYNAGQATVRILDPDGDFNPQNIDSPIYGYVTTGRKLRISYFDNIIGTGYLFTGYISDYRYTFPQGQETGYVTITAFDAFKLFNTSAITTVTGAGAGDTTGERIWQILDQIDWPADMRAFIGISGGAVECENDNGTSRSALTAIRLAEISENGAFFINAEGTACFADRDYVYNPVGTNTYPFSNDDFVAFGFEYQNIKFAFDDKRLYNSATITREGGSPQTYSDTASIDEYFLHSYTQSNLIMRHNAEALLLAEGYVEARKDNDIRIDSMTVDVLASDIYREFIFDIDYFTGMDITNVTPQGSIVQKSLQVQGIAHDITPTSWNITYTTLEPLIVSEYWL
jgi:hypothetical protein